ncbi:MAG: hypothetical protein H0W72_00400, partial [Planctomycetes bacterium]|nr:hypothetical protein [Planctomycetota bacterium]
MRSLRARLLAGTVAATIVFLASTGLVLYGLVRSALYNEFDAVLGSKARILALMVVEGDGWHKIVAERSQFPEYEPQPDAEFYQIWRSNGSTMVRSPSLEDGNLPLLAGTVKEPLCRALPLPDARAGRIAGIRFVPRREDGEQLPHDRKREMVLVVARSTELLDQRLTRFRWLLFGVCAGAIIVASAALVLVVGSLLRPVNHLAERIASLRPEDLSARFSAAWLPTELRPVARRLDDLLRRLDAAFAREKAFTADVAHELRTPIAGLLTTMEVMLSKPREPAVYQETLRDCLDIGRRMQALVDNLLSLAQLEGDRVEVKREPVQIDYLLRETWKLYQDRAATRGAKVEWLLGGAVFVETDCEKLRIVIANLFDNAVSYVDQGGTVSINASAQGDQCVVTVANTGCPLAQEQVERVFDRFWRGDTARTNVGLHAGLGLSLCRKL